MTRGTKTAVAVVAGVGGLVWYKSAERRSGEWNQVVRLIEQSSGGQRPPGFNPRGVVDQMFMDVEGLVSGRAATAEELESNFKFVGGTLEP